jgi:diketogulonate reductase-like aldo/keto reductase
VTKIDLPVLAKQLNALAEVFDKKPVTPAALEVWFDTLREFPCEQVMTLLISWPQSHHKFPVPAEVWKSMNEWAIDRRERKALIERQQPAFHPGVGGAKAEEFIAKMRATLNNPAFSPLEHWQRVYDKQPAGSIGRKYAEEVLKKKGVIEEREPGSDDEPLKDAA